MKSPFSIAIHGGAGTILKENMTDDLEKVYQEALNESVNSAFLILEKGGSSLDAVELAVKILEDFPLFNSGRGSVFNSNGTHEMDASIMEGATGLAGAVALVKNIKNPILLARLVMEKTPHVFLAGEGATQFAKEMQIEFVSDAYFHTDHRHQQWLDAIRDDVILLDHTVNKENKYGTVGAVALDKYGNLSAATSTGGMTNKKFGRVGDTPLIGAGTYANNETCAVSCTGSGEYFIRTSTAFHLHALMKYGGKNMFEAGQELIHEILQNIGGDGGLIAVNKEGDICLSFNTEGMYRAYMKSSGEKDILIYK